MEDANTTEAVRLPKLVDRSTRTNAQSIPGGTVELGTVHVIVGDSHARVVLSGEIDADLAIDLQQATRDLQKSELPIEVDAHHVTFMDSTGVAFLARLASITSWPVRVFNTPPTVRFLLDVTNVGSMLELVEDQLPAADFTTGI